MTPLTVLITVGCVKVWDVYMGRTRRGITDQSQRGMKIIVRSRRERKITNLSRRGREMTARSRRPRKITT